MKIYAKQQRPTDTENRCGYQRGKGKRERQIKGMGLTNTNHST